MRVGSRVTQDRRYISRLGTRIGCSFIHQEKSHEAVMIDLSLNGASISSKFLPPIGDPITLLVQLPESGKALQLSAKVIRSSWGTSDHGRIGKFGIRFGSTPLDLVSFISKLNK